MENGKVVELSREDLMGQLDKKQDELKELQNKDHVVHFKAQQILDNLIKDLKATYLTEMPTQVQFKANSSSIEVILKKEDGFDKVIFNIYVRQPYDKADMVIELNYYTTNTDSTDTFELRRLKVLGKVAHILQLSGFKDTVINKYKEYAKFLDDNFVNTYLVTDDIVELKKEIAEMDFQAKLKPGLIWQSPVEDQPARFWTSERNNFWANKVEIIKINEKTVKIKYSNKPYNGYEQEIVVRIDWMKSIFNKIEEVKKMKTITKEMV